ncbi:MAG: hypothetical protein OET90_06875 [Desulfuromonadales bacterium]|nr:hypothetical protein [Desulfuromonadales bacterium]
MAIDWDRINAVLGDAIYQARESTDEKFAEKISSIGGEKLLELKIRTADNPANLDE